MEKEVIRDTERTFFKAGQSHKLPNTSCYFDEDKGKLAELNTDFVVNVLYIEGSLQDHLILTGGYSYASLSLVMCGCNI